MASFKIASAFIELSARNLMGGAFSQAKSALQNFKSQAQQIRGPQLATAGAGGAGGAAPAMQDQSGIASRMAGGVANLHERMRNMGAAIANVTNQFRTFGLVGKATLIGLAAVASPVAMLQFGYATRDLAGVIGRELVPFLQMLTAGIRYVADSFASLDPATRKTIVTLAVVGTAVATLIGAFPLLTGGISAVITTVKVLTGVFMGFNVATGGVLLIIGAVATALAGLGIYFATTKEGASSFAGIFQGLAGVLEAFKQVGLSVWAELKPAFQQIGSVIAGAFTQLGQAVMGLMPLFRSMAGAFGHVMGFVGKLAALVIKLGATWVSIIAANPIVQGLVGLFKGFYEIMGAAWKRLSEVLNPLFGALDQLSAAFTRTFGGQFSGLFSGLLPLVKFVVNGMVGAFQVFIQTLTSVITTVALLVDSLKDPTLLSPGNFVREMQRRMQFNNEFMNKQFTAIGKPTATSMGAGGGGQASFSSVAEVQRKAQLSALMTPGTSKEALEERQAKGIEDVARRMGEAMPLWRGMLDGIRGIPGGVAE